MIREEREYLKIWQYVDMNPCRWQDSGLYYLQSRYYDPELGRFLNADSYASTGQGIIGCNMFAYCGNNPICCVDYRGKEWAYVWEFLEDVFGDDEAEELDDTTVAVSYGEYVSFTLGAFNITFTNETAVDFKGNIQRNCSCSFDVTTAAAFSVSAGNSGSIFFVPNTSYLNGGTNYMGGSKSIPLPYTPFAFTGSANVGQTTDGYWGLMFSGGLAPAYSAGGELHAGHSSTTQTTPRINIGKVIELIVEYMHHGG